MTQTVGASTQGGLTVQWSSPELLKGKRKDRASDVFALAVTLWEIFERDTPFAGMADMIVINQILANVRPEIEKTPAEFRSLVQRAWTEEAKSPTRFPTFKNEEEEEEKEEKEEEDFICGLKNNTNNSTVFCLFGESSACEYSSYYFIIVVIIILLLLLLLSHDDTKIAKNHPRKEKKKKKRKKILIRVLKP